MIVLHAVFPIKPDRLDDALALTEMLIEESNEEPGVIDYRAATDVEDETTIRFFEQYEDAAAMEAHVGSDHFAELDAALPDLLAGEPELTQFEVDSVSDVEL